LDDPVELRIVRPYGTENAFLEREAWTLDAKGAVLIDQASLEPGTLVRFDVVLANGERVIRAEGRVVKAIPATATRPGGLRVRFTRFGGSTKTLIDRVVAERRRNASAPPTEAGSEVRSSVRAVPVPLAKPPPAESGTLQQALRERSVRQIVAPEHRDALLERLRRRHRSAS
jgi:hypothetical protein